MENKITKQAISDDLKRVAALLGKNCLKAREYDEHGEYSSTTVLNKFGSWNLAISEAGLKPYQPNSSPRYLYSDEELLQHSYHLGQKLGKRPGVADINAFSPPHSKCYLRFGSVAKAWDLALEKYGPLKETLHDITPLDINRDPIDSHNGQIKKISKRFSGKADVSIEYHQLDICPRNEDDTIFLFRACCHRLGFKILLLRSRYPDCKALRCVDKDGNEWKAVWIEFEYRSSNFSSHLSRKDQCDLVVCWINDVQDFPLEVLELSKVFAD